MSTDALHLLRLDLDLPRLFSLCQRQRLPPVEDLGYAIHCGLAAAFGDDAPSLFAVTHGGPTSPRRPGQERMLELLAYSSRSLSELRAQAETYADPEAFRLVDWERAADKPMPAAWRPGQRLGFQVRACPTVRVAKAGPHVRAGAEVDAFLAAAWKEPEGPKPDREAVYRGWLSSALARTEGARVQEAVVDRFELQTLLRRTQGPERRAKQRLRKPDVTFRGVLEVVEPEAFGMLLRRGVGRHRAFGFGMLLLRPHRGAPC
ncbi:type I-E CRISPR-associated protein Cas6/Cse3/CasE [Paraliomyxa miuraensis]|uniref:type I-E CRISPR-associated protein Cas6/Cse3/CasE n=1 Tax=Paraliomyxa miuraensis TaxID=376150 RepID=UPI0022592B4D|nr:type I-E CRISPR-associated protein Cas6/Cse3/CasE [Paraliomyxa miuraensis]MCX4244415.1 type I-E CRISPR-associated protein Cas6/Cse3/CasE [Paraliomyxa miuraensis]